MFKKSSIALLLVAFSFGLSDAKLDNCPENRRKEADDCAKDVFFLMDPNFKPATAETLPDYCKKMNDQIKCVEKYGKDCLKGFTKQSLTIGTNGFKKLWKQICPPNAPKKEEFLKRTQWMKKEANAEVYTCSSGAIKNYVYISKNVTNEEQIKQGCCNYWIVRDCLDKKIGKLTTAANQKFFNTIADDTMTNLIKFLCTKQDSLKTCREIMPKELDRMDQTMKSIKKSEREEQESFLIPFLQVISD